MSLKSDALYFSYQNIFKPIAFRIDPELVHERITYLGESLENQEGLLTSLFSYQHPNLEKEVLGIKFVNPIGLAAGFDYDGQLARVMKYIGFGFNTVGTVTAKPYVGNPRPRLARLPKSRSLLVNKGFKSEGAKKVAKRLDKKNLQSHPVGVSIGSTNSPEVNSISKAIDDYLISFEIFKKKKYLKYLELNISCPNTLMPEPFTDPKNFKKLTSALKKSKVDKPIFVKMPNEIDQKKSDELVQIALKNGIYGFIFSNLVKDRKNIYFDKDEIKSVSQLKGNFSGYPTTQNALALIKHTRKKFGKRIAIIGCGGTFSASDAQEKLDAGADLVQLITGMIFGGPQLIGQICEGLVSGYDGRN